MTYPKGVTVRGRDWLLSFVKGLINTAECYGITLAEEQVVKIDAKISSSQQEVDTVIHELLHVCYASTSLPHIIGEDQKDKDEKEELIVDSLAPAVLSLIVDNPELITKIQERYEEGRL